MSAQQLWPITADHLCAGTATMATIPTLARRMDITGRAGSRVASLSEPDRGIAVTLVDPASTDEAFTAPVIVASTGVASPDAVLSDAANALSFRKFA